MQVVDVVRQVVGVAVDQTQTVVSGEVVRWIDTTTADALAAHEADTTGVHGIADTSALVVDTDARLTDARTPTAHASSHATAGSDPITPASIGASATGHTHTEADVTGLTADLAAREPIVWRSGRYYTQPQLGQAVAAPTLNALILTPLWVPAACTLDRIVCEVVATVASGTSRMGLYANDSATDRPSALIVDAGTVATDATTGMKEATISQAVNAGWLWLAYVAQVATCSIRIMDSGFLAPVAATTAKVSVAGSSYYVASVTGSLPSTVAPSSTAITVGVRQYVRVA